MIRLLILQFHHVHIQIIHGTDLSKGAYNFVQPEGFEWGFANSSVGGPYGAHNLCPMGNFRIYFTDKGYICHGLLTWQVPSISLYGHIIDLDKHHLLLFINYLFLY